MQPKTDHHILSSLVHEIKSLLDKEVFITNESGVIIACTDQEKLNHYHEGALLAMRTKEKLMMEEDLSQGIKGFLEGVLIPLKIDQYLTGVIGVIGDPKIIEPYVHIVEKVAELFLRNNLDQMFHEKNARNLELFIYDWLHGNITDEQITERGNFFNIDVKNYRQVIIVKFPFIKSHFTYEELKSLKKAWEPNRNTLFVRWGTGKIVILDVGYERATLKRKIELFIEKTSMIHQQQVYIGVGQVYNYQQLKESFKQAEKCCSISKIEKRIIFEEELRFEMLQYELDTKVKEIFIQRTIEPILHDKNLLNTLDSWLKNNMSIQDTAEDLKIHKNTLYYRLEKITKLTNLDVNNIDDIVLLYVSNRLIKEVS